MNQSEFLAITCTTMPLGRFSSDCRTTNAKVFTPTNQNRSNDSAMKQSEFLSVTCNLLEVREKWRIQGFHFTSHWFKNWHEIWRVTMAGCVITFNSRLKTALAKRQYISSFSIFFFHVDVCYGTL